MLAGFFISFQLTITDHYENHDRVIPCLWRYFMKLIEKPDQPFTDAVVELTGKDGNAFFILGQVRRWHFA
jgi:hypothetical protein